MKSDAIKFSIVKGFLSGLGWMIGATIGFALLLALLTLVLNWAGGLPVAGEIIANIIEATNRALEAKKLIPR
jgi:hypothetical protein